MNPPQDNRGSRAVAKPRRFTRGQVLSFAVAGALAIGVGGVATQAAFSDTSIATSTLTTGTLAIDLNGTDTNYKVPFPITALEPGTSTSATIKVNSTGTINSAVALTTSASGGTSGLAAALDVTIKDGATTLYTGKLDKAAFTKLAVNGKTTKSLTIAVTAPTAMKNALQGKTDTVTFTFDATQASLS